MMHQADDRVGVRLLICGDERRMIELVLNQDVNIGREPEREIICQVRCVIPPWKGNDFNFISLTAQVFDKFAVIQISAAQGAE